MEPKKNYDITSPELIAKAQSMVFENQKYAKLKKNYDSLMQRHMIVQAMQVRQQMDAIMKAVVTKLVEQKIEERKSSEEIIKMLPEADANKYRELLNVMCFCFDAIDYVITDLNDIMKRNETGFNMEALPEIKACKEKVSSVVGAEAQKMNDKEQQTYYDEADRIYNYLQARGGVFRRKLDKLTNK